MWVDSLFKAIGEALGLYKQTTDPEVIRQAEIRDIDNKLDYYRKLRDEYLAKEITPENEEQNAIGLGLCINNIIELLKKRDRLKK